VNNVKYHYGILNKYLYFPIFYMIISYSCGTHQNCGILSQIWHVKYHARTFCVAVQFDIRKILSFHVVFYKLGFDANHPCHCEHFNAIVFQVAAYLAKPLSLISPELVDYLPGLFPGLISRKQPVLIVYPGPYLYPASCLSSLFLFT